MSSVKISETINLNNTSCSFHRWGLILLGGVLTILVGLKPLAGFGLSVFSFLVWVLKRKARSIGFSLALLLTVMSFIDIIRRFFEGNPALLLGIDLALLLTYFFFYIPWWMGWEGERGDFLKNGPSLLQWALAAYLAVVAIQLFNPFFPSLTLSLLGFRIYLLAVPMLGIGHYCSRHWKSRDYRRAFLFGMIILHLVILFALIQFTLDPGLFGAIISNLLVPMEHQAHSYGSLMFRLVSSFFASSKRFGRFLLFLYPFLWAYAARSGQERIKGYLFFLTGLGVFISGSREAVILFCLFNLFVWAVRKHFFGKTVFCVGIVVMFLVLISSYDPYEIREQNLLSRARFLISHVEDYGFRIRYMFYQPFTDVYTLCGQNIWLGTGVGRYGQEIQALGEGASPWDGKLDFPSVDAGVVKIILELGVPGLFFFLAFHGLTIICFFLYPAWRQIFSPPCRKDPFLLLGFVFPMWLLLFFKAHPVLSDQMNNIFYWFYFGFSLERFNQWEREYADCG